MDIVPELMALCLAGIEKEQCYYDPWVLIGEVWWERLEAGHILQVCSQGGMKHGFLKKVMVKPRSDDEESWPAAQRGERELGGCRLELRGRVKNEPVLWRS